METTENLVLKVNELLEENRIYRRKFDYLLNEFRKLANPKIVLIDFEYYSEERLGILKSKRIDCIQNQNFTEAARYRTLEKECQEFIELKDEYGISKSMFFFENEYLFYFYFGTGKIDKKVREYLKL
jgi:hypothetical protein